MKKLKYSLLFLVSYFLFFGFGFSYYSSYDCTYSHLYNIFDSYLRIFWFLWILDIAFIVYLIIDYIILCKRNHDKGKWYMKIGGWFILLLIISTILLAIFSGYEFDHIHNRIISYILYSLLLICIFIFNNNNFVKKIILIILCILNILGVVSYVYTENYEPECVVVYNTCGDKEFEHNKKIEECNKNCNNLDGYNEKNFLEWYAEKYGERPVKIRYDVRGYPRDFSSYSGYNEWIETVFPDDIEKIKEYNECIKECGPMVEQPGCPA